MSLDLKKIDYIMIMVENMDRSIEFYRDILGLPLKFSSESWTEFNVGPTTLALHGGGTANSKNQSKAPHNEVAGTASIGFNVADVHSVYEKLISQGVKFSLAPTMRPSEGLILAIAQDPDGLDVSFGQSIEAKNV